MFTGEMYIVLCVSILPFIDWMQRDEGRNYFSMFLTGFFLIFWLWTNSLPVVWDTITILTTCFFLWMIASVSWSHSRQSTFDLFTMAVGLCVFLIARMIPLDFLLAAIFLPGPIFAGVSMAYRKKDEGFHEKYRNFIFGNVNHLNCFLLMPIFAGMWLTFNFSLWFLPFVLLMMVQIALSEARATQIGLVTGLLFILCLKHHWMIPVSIVVSSVFLFYIIKKRGSIAQRMAMWYGTWILIKKKSLAGYGLRTFRREYPNIMPELYRNEFVRRLFPKTDISVGELITSHRVHNDHLELVFELGILGYLIFLSIFFSLPWSANPLLSGAIVAFAVNGLFFFPLREAHTALPFWAMAGAIAGIGYQEVAVDQFIAYVIILIIGRILWLMGVKAVALAYYEQASRITVEINPETEERKQLLAQRNNFIRLAIFHDPYNNAYLTEGYFYNVFNNPILAFQYASRCLENCDGGKQKWGILDQYARAQMAAGGINIARKALETALFINPNFKQSQELMENLNVMARQIEEQAAQMQTAGG